MAETGDLISEFKQAKPPEKIIIVTAVIAVIGVALYLFNKSKSGSSATPADYTSGAPTAQTAGYPSVGANQTPVLPSGVNPLYDPNGNLVAFQNPAGNANGPLMTGSGTPPVGAPPGRGLMRDVTTMPNWYQNVVGKLGYNSKISAGGVDYSLNAQRFWTSPSSFFYAPIGSTISPGAQGRIWLQLPNNQPHQLLTGSGMLPSKTAVATTAASSTH